MASVVKIEIQVDENGAVTGFRSLNTAGAQVTTTIKGVGAAGTQMGQQVAAGAAQAAGGMKQVAVSTTQVSTAAQSAGNAGTKAMQQIHQHTLTSMDSVRLFRDEFGIHIPRSMEKAIASSKTLMTGLNAMQGAMVAVGGVGVLVALGTQIYDVGKEIFKADDEVQKFNEHLSETARQKFMDTRSIEDARDAIRQTSSDLAKYDKQLASMPKSKAGMAAQAGLGPAGLGALIGDPLSIAYIIARVKQQSDQRAEIDKDRNASQENSDKATLQGEEGRHKKVMADLEAESKRAASIAMEPARAARENQIDRLRNAENQTHAKNDSVITNTIGNRTDKHQVDVDAKAGDEERGSADEIADAELQSKNTEFARQRHDEIVKLQNDATNAGLKGEQLLDAQRREAIADFVRRYKGSRDAVNAIDLKYHNEEMERLHEQSEAVLRRSREASLAGRTGVDSLQQRGDNRQAEISADLKDGKYFGTADQQNAAADADRASAKRETDAAIEAEQRRFTESIDSLAASSTDRQVKGFARIQSEGAKQLTELQRRFDEVYGHIDQHSATYTQGLDQLHRGQSAISGSTNSQVAELARKNSDETGQLEREAAAKSLPQMQQREAEIRAQYDDEKASYLRMLDDKEIGDTDYLRRKLAAERKMNAELANEARAQRDRLAGELEPFLKNPLEALKNAGYKMASQQLANVMIKANGGTAPGDPSGKHDGLIHFPFGSGPRHGAAAQPGSQAGADAGHAVASMTVTATQVTVNSGSVVLQGGGAGASTGSGGTFSSGSTVPAARGGLVMRSRTGSPAAPGAATSPGSAAAAFDAAQSSSAAAATSDAPVAPPAFSEDVAGNVDPSGSRSYDTLNGGWTGSGQKISNDVTGTLSTVQSTTDSLQQAFGKDSSGSGSGSSGSGGSGATNPTSSLINTVTPYASAGAGIYSAVESNGGLGGAFTGGMAGMKLGSLVGGPIGAGIGLAAGAVIGFIGFGGAEKAAEYDRKQVRPRIANDILQFGTGAMDYQSALQDLIQLDQEARKQTKQWGMGGKRQWNDHIHPEIITAQHQLTREQKAGRSQYSSSAAQFHGGGYVSGFGDFATSPNEGWGHLKIGETVMHERATDTHGDALAMMLGNASRRQMAAYYGAAEMAPSYRSAMQQASFGGSGHTYNYGHTYNVDAIDTQSFEDRIMSSKHTVRRAQNASYAENSGGSDLG